MPHRLTRRRFLQTAAAAGAAGYFSGRLTAADKKPGPDDRLQIGVIGVAGQGQYDWTEAVKAGAEVVAWCDVDENRTGTARAAFSRASFDVDFRALLDRKGIDAVIIATPDHTHAVATVAALKSGRHVYCEKPLTHDVYEARIVAETAAREKRVTQMGTQIHNHPSGNYRRLRGADPERRHRRGEGSPRLVRHDLRRGETPRGDRTGGEGTALGPVAGHGPGAPVLPRQG